MQNLELRFSSAIATLQRDKTQFSLFAVENLERLLSSQYEKEEKYKNSKWLEELNELDFLNRTRAFFQELRKRHKVRENFVPIRDNSGVLSNNVDETLENWAEYYKKLYSSNDKMTCFPTPDNDEFWIKI